MITKFNNRGFSMVELLVALGIFSLIIAGIAEIFLSSLRSGDVITEQLRSQGDGRRALLKFTSEARHMQNGSNGGYPLAVASSTEIVFYSNIDADNLVERVRYFLNGRTLARAVTKPTGTPPGYLAANEIISPLINFVTTGTPIFYYYDQDYTGSEPPLNQPVETGQVRLVEIKFAVDKDLSRPPGPLTFISKAQPRNLKN